MNPKKQLMKSKMTDTNFYFYKSSKIALSVLTFLLFSTTIMAQTFDWAKRIGGINEDIGTSVAVDNAGNVYTTGYLQGTIDFDPNTGVTALTAMGTYDTYIQKLDAGGNLVWAKRIGGPNSYTIGHSIAIDDVGNIYTIGNFDFTVDFNPNAGVANIAPSGASDAFLQKLDSAGNFLWAKRIVTSNGYENLNVICLDGLGNLYITGTFGGTADFDPNVGVANITAVGTDDVFVQKLDTAGNLIWAKGMGGTLFDIGGSIAVDNVGNVYTTGAFKGTMDIDPNGGITNVTSLGGDDIFIQKLDAAGNFLWGKAMGGTSADRGTSVAVDDFGSVYVTGSFFGTVDLDPNAGISNFISAGQSDIFIQKLDANGNYLWATSIGGIAADKGNALTFDDMGNLYATGTYYGTVDFDPSAATSNLISGVALSGFVLKLDATDNFISAHSMGGTGGCEGNSIIVSSSGNIYTAGYFQSTVDFNPSAGTNDLTSVGNKDIFIHKMTQCTASPSTDIITACGAYTWINGMTYTTSNNTATRTFMSFGGCDSVVTLDLTINTVDVTTTLSGTDVMANAAGAIYQWLDCNNANASIVGEINQNFTPTANGDYAVEITQNGCVDTSTCVNVIGVGIFEANALFSKVSMFPNPSNGLVNINLGNLENVSIKVFTVTGQLTYMKENINSSIFQFELNETAGVYFVEVSANGEKGYFKLIKKGAE